MPVTNIECQIAKGQIGRYLAGDAFSHEALKQLEAHIQDCPNCKDALIERKAALQAMIGATGPVTKAVVETESASPAPNPMAAALRQQVEREKASEKQRVKEELAAARAALTPGKPTLVTRPIILASVLTVVLFGMSYAVKGMSPFGPKADVLPSSSEVSRTRAAPGGSGLAAPVAAPKAAPATALVPAALLANPAPVTSQPPVVAKPAVPKPSVSAALVAKPGPAKTVVANAVATPKTAKVVSVPPKAQAKPQPNKPVVAAHRPAAKAKPHARTAAPKLTITSSRVRAQHPRRAAHRKHVRRKSLIRPGAGSIRIYR